MENLTEERIKAIRFYFSVDAVDKTKNHPAEKFFVSALSDFGFQVYLGDGRSSNGNETVVSKLILFEEASVFKQKIKSKAFRQAIKNELKNINHALSIFSAKFAAIFLTAVERHYHIRFSFKGKFKLRRKFNKKEIKEMDGIQNALDFFFLDIKSEVSSVQNLKFPSKIKKTKSNEYLFKFSYGNVFAVPENEVRGEGSYAFPRSASAAEINELGIEACDNHEFAAAIFINASFEHEIPSNAELLDLKIKYAPSDYDGLIEIEEIFYDDKGIPKI